MMKINFILTGLLLLIVSASQAQNWIQVVSGTTKKLNTIDFPSATVGYIGGNDSILLKTSDGGKTWNKLNYSGVTFYPNGEHIINLDFINENIGFMAVGPYNGSYKTIDGGNTWTAIPNLITCFNHGIFFFDENNGFIGGSGCFQGELMNRLSSGTWGAANINSNSFLADNYIVDIDFLNANVGLAASKSGYVFRTIDGGQNWDTISASITKNPLTSVLFVNSNLVYAGYSAVNTGFGLYFSTDGGLTWQEDMNSATFLYPDFNSLHKSEDGMVYSGGYTQSMTNGVIFNSPGDGSTWNFSLLDFQINAISSHSDSVVFGVGENGYIVVNKDLLSLGASINEYNSNDFKLFPNPVTSELNIVHKDGFINENGQIAIFSMTGELVFSEKFSPKINLKELSNGVYMVQVITEKGIVTERIVKN